MNKIFKKIIKREKQEMKNRYLSGETVASIAADYETCSRNISYHLSPLSAKEKGIHIQNLALKSDLKRSHEKNALGVDEKTEQTGLDDFK